MPKSKENGRFISYNRTKKDIMSFIMSNHKEDKNGCWIWQKCFFKSGYGALTVNNKTSYAHRVSYELFNGELGKKHVIHKCDNRKCINPKHLSSGTNYDNVQDMVKKKRQCMGEKQGNSKLKSHDVLEIRELYKTGRYYQRELGKIFNVSRPSISTIVNKKSWSHI